MLLAQTCLCGNTHCDCFPRVRGCCSVWFWLGLLVWLGFGFGVEKRRHTARSTHPPHASTQPWFVPMYSATTTGRDDGCVFQPIVQLLTELCRVLFVAWCALCCMLRAMLWCAVVLWGCSETKLGAKLAGKAKVSARAPRQNQPHKGVDK